MKKFFLSIITTAFITLSSFANSSAEVNQTVIKSFQKEFNNASNVEWTLMNGLNKATFTLNGNVMFAFYTNSGERVALTRNLTSDQLPIVLTAELKKNYEGYWITDLFEIATDSQTSYYVTLENADHKIVLESVGVQGWQSYKKEKKN
jgi:hypothetical protein